MPTVLTMSGLRVAIYPNDHRPAHVHVQGGGCEAVFNLGCPVGPPQLRENYGFMQRQAARIRGQLAERLAALCAAWSYLHGYD